MAIFKPVTTEFSNDNNKFLGICKFAIMGFEDKSGMFDWADLYIEVEVKQEHSDYNRKLQIKGSYEKDDKGNITGGSVLKRLYNFFDAIGCTAGINVKGEWEDGEGAKIDKDGGVTPGKFDHDSNPIDMVQDGEKIGEATGGELILPPKDVEEIRDALKDGDKNATFRLMEDLVAKYDDNVIGDDDDSEAQEGAKVQQPTVPPLDQDRAQEIVKVMKDNADQVRNVGELPFDEDPTNPAGLVKYIGDKLSFDIDSTSKAEIDFIKNYREFLLKEKGRADVPKMMGGGYLDKLKARVGAYMKSKY